MIIVPVDFCEHPLDRIRATIVQPAPHITRVFAECAQCTGVWTLGEGTTNTMPSVVVDRCQQLIDAGHIRPGVL